MTRSAVFLDRDGVLNSAVVREGKPLPPANVDDLRFEPGVETACAQLRAAGHLLICVTNQPDLARGTTSPEAVALINDRIVQTLKLDDLRVCAHDDHHNCACRKPRPGLILDCAAEYRIALNRSVMVGDRWRDVEAGRSAGVATVFLDKGYDERQPDSADYVARFLADATPWIINHLAAASK